MSTQCNPAHISSTCVEYPQHFTHVPLLIIANDMCKHMINLNVYSKHYSNSNSSNSSNSTICLQSID